ncbi:hypothetical protein VN97_g13245, partial [Penicillium thymicola]
VCGNPTPAGGLGYLARTGYIENYLVNK